MSDILLPFPRSYFLLTPKRVIGGARSAIVSLRDQHLVRPRTECEPADRGGKHGLEPLGCGQAGQAGFKRCDHTLAQIHVTRVGHPLLPYALAGSDQIRLELEKRVTQWQNDPRCLELAR